MCPILREIEVLEKWQQTLLLAKMGKKWAKTIVTY